MDSIQQQLDRLLHLFLEEQASNRAHREELHSKIEALSQKESGQQGSGQQGSGQQESQQEDGQSSHQRPNMGSGGGGTLPRFAKLDFPKYNGSEDPLGWLNRCEHFFRHQHTLDAEKVGLASYHLEGNAQLWLIQLMEDYPDPSWETFKGQCNLRFGPPIRSNKLGELAKLQQTGNVSDYQTQFEILVSRAGALSQMQKVQLYISGLQDYIAVEVELHSPRDLATAMSMSRLYEKKFTEMTQGTPPSTPNLPIPPGKIVKRLTPDEMLDRRRKGLCFNCDEPFRRGHQCAKLFWFEITEDDPPDGAQHALMGT